MLKNRVITGICLALAAAAGILVLPAPWLAAVFAVVAGLAAWEWAGCAGMGRALGRGLYVGVLGAVLAAAYGSGAVRAWSLWLGLVVWACAVAAVLAYPAGLRLWRRQWVLAGLGIAVIGCAWSGALTVRGQPQGSLWLLWLFVLVAVADVGAYFAGRAWGRRKLAPVVSPGKTWEGALGGALLSALVCGGALALWGLLSWFWAAATLALIVVAVFGDLLESLLKREAGVKDSGALLPGHGGVLDRIDSALAALPVFALLLLAV